MTIDELKNFVFFIARKKQSGTNPTPSQFNTAIQRAFVEWIMGRIGNPQEYQPGAPIPRIAYENTQKIKDDLRFLLEKRDFNTTQLGQLKVPDGTTPDLSGSVAPAYLAFSSLRYEYLREDRRGRIVVEERDVDIKRDGEIGGYLSSTINKPSESHPVAAFYSDHIQFYPKGVRRVVFTYLRTPTPPVWAYTISSGRAVYDPANSVDVESPDITHNDIAIRALRYLGISIREEQLQGYAEQMRKEGI